MKKLLKKIIAVGLSAVMALGSAVTSFAADEPTLKLDKTEITLYQPTPSAGTMQGSVTATTGGEGTLAATSENAEIAKVEVKDKNIVVTPVKPGVVTISVTYGTAKASFKATVKHSYTALAKRASIYSDSAKTNEIGELDEGLYENGGKVAPASGGDKVDYKTLTIYTDMETLKTDPNVTDAKVVEKEGKIVVAVTKAEDNNMPVDESGKLKSDKDAEKIVKPSIKNGVVTLKAGTAGTVNLWIIDLGANKEAVNFIVLPVTVLEASAKVEVGTVDDKDVFTAIKSTTVIPEKKYTYTVRGLKKDGKVAADAELAVDVDAKSKSLIKSAEIEEKNGVWTLSVTANKLTTAKVAKAKLNIYDIHSGKKTALTVSIADTVATIKTEHETTDISIEKDTATLKLTVATNGGGTITTDKAKVYVVAKDKKPYMDEKGKISVKEVSRKDIAAKLDKNNNLILTAKDNYSTCDVYIAYTCSSTKKVQIVKVASVRDGKLSGVTKSEVEALAAKPQASVS